MKNYIIFIITLNMSIVKFQTLENPNTSPLHVLANIKKVKPK